MPSWHALALFVFPCTKLSLHNLGMIFSNFRPLLLSSLPFIFSISLLTHLLFNFRSSLYFTNLLYIGGIGVRYHKNRSNHYGLVISARPSVHLPSSVHFSPFSFSSAIRPVRIELEGMVRKGGRTRSFNFIPKHSPKCNTTISMLPVLKAVQFLTLSTCFLANRLIINAVVIVSQSFFPEHLLRFKNV